MERSEGEVDGGIYSDQCFNYETSDERNEIFVNVQARIISKCNVLEQIFILQRNTK